MIVVGKGHVDRLRRPFELQGQEGFLFYARDETNGVSDVAPFFNRGRANSQFYDRRDQLTTFLQKRVDRIAAGAAVGADAASGPSDRAAERADRLSREARERHEGGLRAPRLRASGQRLQRRSRCGGRPSKRRGRARHRQRRAGEGGGLGPSGRARSRALRRRGSIRSSSCSLCWRAKRRCGTPINPSASFAASFGRRKFSTRRAALRRRPAVERDPLQGPRALRQADRDRQDRRRHPQQVRRIPVPVSRRNGASAGRDRPRAETSSRSISPITAPTKTMPRRSRRRCAADRSKSESRVAEADADARRYNNDLLVKCDAVTLCWANASEVWVRSEADKLSDWQALGRKQPVRLPEPHRGSPAIRGAQEVRKRSASCSRTANSTR